MRIAGLLLTAIVSAFSFSGCEPPPRSNPTSEDVDLALGTTVVRIRAGVPSSSPPFVDNQGNTWSSDVDFDVGNAASNVDAIGGTANPALYHAERYANRSAFPNGFSYDIPVAPGAYDVTLHFAETYPAITGPGQRQFDVSVNGKKVLSNFDIFEVAGGLDRAVQETFRVLVPGGTGSRSVHIQFAPGLAQNPKVNAIAVKPAPVNGIPTTFWGMHVNRAEHFPLALPFGAFRGWDGSGAQWPEIETCAAKSGDPADPCFHWTSLDAELAAVKASGVDDVMYTLSRTPAWATTAAEQADESCNYYRLGPAFRGACYMPADLAPDGSGSNATWKNWIRAIATRVNDPVYRQTHARVRIWEPWNEAYRSTTLGDGYTGTVSFQGTYAQLVRLTEDLRCVLTGKGSIHHWPTAGGPPTPCAATPIDPDALVTTPSSSLGIAAGRTFMENFLYCSASLGTGSPCTTGDAGAAAIDIVDYHLYLTNTSPEIVATQDIPAASSFLRAAERAKPLMNGEGSWGSLPNPKNRWSADAYARAGFIPRVFALYWSAGVRYNMWYSYDTDTGRLFDPAAGVPLEPEGTAWAQTYAWLAGSVPVSSPFCSTTGTIFACDLRRSDGRLARLVWDAKYGQGCASTTNPIVCGSTPYDVPTSLGGGWIDLSGVSHAPSARVLVGANPILLVAP
jgi:hypothetical protein